MNRQLADRQGANLFSQALRSGRRWRRAAWALRVLFVVLLIGAAAIRPRNVSADKAPVPQAAHLQRVTTGRFGQTTAVYFQASATIAVDDSVQGTGRNQFNYVGAWGHCLACSDGAQIGMYNLSNSWDATANDYLTVTFGGTGIKLYGVTRNRTGIGAVSIDGGAETLIDTYSPTDRGDQLLWSSTLLPAGTHTLKLRVTGTKNPASTGFYVTPDRVDILASVRTPPTATHTNTPVPLTSTPLPPTSTATSTATRTNTPLPATSTATGTPISPTHTATPTNTWTRTPVPPTNTPAATATSGSLVVRVTSASALPATVSVGGSEKLATTISTTAVLGGAIVDFEVYDNVGNKVYQTYQSGVNFAAYSPQGFQATWSVPTNQATGSYTLKLGVFATGWMSLYTWDNQAATFTVSTATATNTPVLPTSTATSTATRTNTPIPATPTRTNTPVPPTASATPPTGSATPLPATATATGTPHGGTQWTNVTGNLANMPSQCGNLTMLSAVPNADTVIAGVALDGLWATNNSGTSWSPLGTGSSSDTIVNRPSWITYDPTNPATFWESGIYNSNGAYQTTDGGNTFHHLGSVTHDDFISVDFSDPQRKTLLVGGHEQSRSVWKSTDGGQTWTNIGLNLPSGTGFSSDPVVITSQTYVVNTDTSWGGGSPGIYRTTNGGTTWTRVSSLDPSGPPLVTASGTMYWSSGGGLLKSTDQGVTWSLVGSGLTSTIHPIMLPDGSLVSVAGTRLVISADGGISWSPIGPAMPYTPAGVVYSVNRKAFFIWTWDCGSAVLPNAIEKLDYDFGFATSTPTPMSSSNHA